MKDDGDGDRDGPPHQPDPWAALDMVEAAAWEAAVRTDRLGLVEVINEHCAGQHGLAPLAVPTRCRPTGITGVAGGREAMPAPVGDDRVVLEFALQFSLDVSSITGDQRRALGAHLGDQTADLSAVIFVMDFVPRTRAALDALSAEAFRPPLAAVEPSEVTVPIWEALDRFIREVPRLDALDPITSELVRLRGARQHQCRLCQSLRSRPALLAGADEELFGEVDGYEGSSLTELHRAALAFTDAMIWTPSRIAESVPRLAGQASPAQCTELVFDVTRNALNKIAVALGADAAHVEDGIEIYDVDERGDLVYGLALD